MLSHYEFVYGVQLKFFELLSISEILKTQMFTNRILTGFDISSASEKFESILFVFSYIVCDVIPYLGFLDSGVINLFQIKARKDISMISIDSESIRSEINNSKEILRQTGTIENNGIEESKIPGELYSHSRKATFIESETPLLSDYQKNKRYSIFVTEKRVKKNR
jgi:hypothetical protein